MSSTQSDVPEAGSDAARSPHAPEKTTSATADHQNRALGWSAAGDYPPIRVALTYRVLQHWRVPVFRRLASNLKGQFRAYHGPDFPGTKTLNSKNLSGFEHCQLPALRLTLTRDGDRAGIPVCPTLLFHLIRYRPDVVLAEGGSNLPNNVFVWLYGKLTGTPYVWWTLGDLRPAKRVSLPLRIWRNTLWFLEARAGALLGYSSLAKRYFDNRGYPREKQFRAVNCVDTDAVLARIPRYQEQAAKLRQQLGLTGKQVLLFVGAIYPTKRLEDLIDAFARLQPQHPNARVVIVGDGFYRPTVEQYARDRNVEIIFAGEVIEDVSAYFLLADIFVLPGLGGLSISEAMAHGLPVLATEADGCEVDLIENGKNGFLLTTGDVDQLTAHLHEMLSDPEKARAMGAHSRWLIENRFNINTYLDNVMAALRHAFENSRRGRRWRKQTAANKSR